MIPLTIARLTDPLLDLPGLEIWTSLEGENPGGSIKDRMVFGEFQERPSLAGGRVSEVSAGSTALSLATWAPRFGWTSELFLADDTPLERVRRLESLGARVHLVPRAEGYVRHDEFHRREGTWAFDQLRDHTKKRHYSKLGEQIRGSHGVFDLIIGAVGTGHSLRGLAEGLKTTNVWSAEPVSQKVQGVRNLDEERYGSEDPCHPENFTKRVFVKSSELFPSAVVESDLGTLSVAPSFALTLGALRKSHIQSGRVWVVSADARRC